MSSIRKFLEEKNYEKVLSMVEFAETQPMLAPPNKNVVTAAIKKGDIEKVKKCIDNGFPADYALIIASELGENCVVNYLLGKGVRDNTALHFAAENGHSTTVGLLLEHGIRHAHALVSAARQQHFKIVDMLIRAGIVDSKDEALEAAVKADSEGIVSLLLYAGARSSLALELAAETGNVEIAKMLVAKGIRSVSAVEVAAANGFTNIVRIIVEAMKNDP